MSGGEVFGPALCVMRYEAVAMANGTPYGLAAAVAAPTTGYRCHKSRECLGGKTVAPGPSAARRVVLKGRIRAGLNRQGTLP
jgi:hypothetical protein